ncbi:MAG: oligosaccharide flippase family protein [Nitrospira sp.]
MKLAADGSNHQLLIEQNKSNHLNGILLSVGGNLVGLIASLGTIMVAARVLSKDDLGAFFLVMVVVQFVALFSDLGLKNTAIKTLSSLPVGSLQFIETTRYLLTITTSASIVGCIVLWSAMPVIKSIWPYEVFHNQLIYVGPISIVTAMFQIITSILVGGKQFKKLSVVAATMEILRAMISAAGLIAGLGVSSLFWGMIISRLVGIGAVWVAMPSWFALSFWYGRSADLFKFGGWLYGGSLISASMVRCSDAILTSYLGPAALAVYSAAMQIPAVMQRVFETTRPALLGYVAAYHGTYEKQQVEAVRILTAVLAVAATMLIPLASPLMTLLYSDQYVSGIMIMQALTLWAVFAIVNYFYSVILIGKGQPRRAFFLTVPQLFIMLLSAPWLVPQYGGFGGAIALIITAFLGNIIGAKIIAGNDNEMWLALVSNMIRAGGPLLLVLVTVTHVTLSIFPSVCLTGLTLAALILLRVITAADVNALWVVLSRIIGRMSIRPTAV